MRIANVGLCLLLLVSAASCREKPDLEALRAEVLALHRSFIAAHLEKDAAYIAEPTSPDYLFVADGTVAGMDAEEMEEMLAGYLDSTQFSAYRDVADPIIGISDDGSLAWAIVQVRTAGERDLADGTFRLFDTRWAWITLYRRDDGRWLRIADVSTKRPYGDTNATDRDLAPNDALGSYLRFSAYTDPGEYARLYDDLPESLNELCVLIKKQLIHPFEVERFAGDIPKDRIYEDEKIPTVSLMLEKLLKRDERGLTASRESRDRLIVACVHHSMLLASILRHRGIPVRIRAGYATYIGGRKDLRVSHVVCEAWDRERNMWMLVDPDRQKIDFPRSEFEFAYETWSRLRRGALGEGRYISRYGTVDLVTVHLLCHDLSYVIGTEEPYWMDPPIVSHIESSISELSPDELEVLDRIAHWLADPDEHMEELRGIRNETPDLRLGEKPN